MQGYVSVEGIRETLGAFGRIDKGLRRELRLELVEVAAGVAAKARQIAEEQGLVESRQLIDRVRPGARASYAYVTDTAKRVSPAYPQGFNYPAVYEYGGGRQRSFLFPAAKAEEEHVVAGIESLLDRLTSETGLQKGGTL